MPLDEKHGAFRQLSYPKKQDPAVVYLILCGASYNTSVTLLDIWLQKFLNVLVVDDIFVVEALLMDSL